MSQLDIKERLLTNFPGSPTAAGGPPKNITVHLAIVNNQIYRKSNTQMNNGQRLNNFKVPILSSPLRESASQALRLAVTTAKKEPPHKKIVLPQSTGASLNSTIRQLKFRRNHGESLGSNSSRSQQSILSPRASQSRAIRKSPMQNLVTSNLQEKSMKLYESLKE